MHSKSASEANVRTAGALKLLRAVRDFNQLWVELDLYNPEALPYFQAQAIDVGIVDVVWNGIAQSMKIAHAAEAFDVNVAPHNFYSHMATVMSAHFAMATPNLRTWNSTSIASTATTISSRPSPRFTVINCLRRPAPAGGLNPTKKRSGADLQLTGERRCTPERDLADLAHIF
ncbi:enolase C-terminal domain-like protein [Brevibacterium sp. CFH 10365]|uniref:enolase C-terminal domain-like protein n=1 Tax=Brevibacterium sp. CFH 10365 TaxID=2585207 RepID=UPI00187AF7A4|nr:enolase C-terminal domain-like protein [Brevibacterium sp. CFH 10365]